MALKPDFGSNSSPLPPLPEIRSDAIRQQIFTHRSFSARPTHLFEDNPDDLSPDNEKYEHLGDAALNLVITTLMLKQYPGLRVGPATKIRALIVGNSTLADISVKYKLPDQLRLHPAQAATLRASVKVQADVFESFVGGLYIEQGLESVKTWLYALFCPYVSAAYHVVRAQHGLPPPSSPVELPQETPSNFEGANMPSGYLALFNQQLQRANREVEWIYASVDPNSPEVDTDVARGARSTPIWYVRVIVDGQHFGKGKGSTKKAARNEAAKEGLQKLGINV